MDDHGKPLDSIIVHGRRVQGETTQQLRVTVERGLAGWVVRNQKPALVPDTSRDTRWLRRPDDAVQQTGAKAALCVPLMARENIVGVLTLVHSYPNAFDRSHLELMQAIADQTGIAILNARLYTESQRQARVMTALADGAMTINSSLQMDDVLQRILNQTIQALQVETVGLALRELSSGDFVFRAATGNQAGNIIGKRVRAGEGLIAKVVQDRQGVVIPALREENPFAKQNSFDGIDSQAIALAPIQAQGKIIGVIEAINPISGVFDPDALLVMTGIGSMAGTTIQNAQFVEKVEETQKRYLELFNDSIDPILVSDWEGNILEGNRKFFSFTGYDRHTIHTMKVEDVHQINWESVGENFDYLRDTQAASYEAILELKEDEKIPVEVYIRSTDLGGEHTILWTFRDIHERKELDSLRNDLTSMIYHDLRSPLANVVSSLEVLNTLLEEKDEAIESVLQIASNSTERIQRLISSLLDVSRLETGQAIATQKGVSPKRLVQDALETITTSILTRRQKIVQNIEENLPNIWADEDMIRRVLINILENASKFTPTEGQISIGVKRDGDFVQLWIGDNGMGIPPEEHERVFEKFARTKSGAKVSGLGIGLAFCRLAVNGHGGKIWIDKNYTNGTRFNINLPIEKEQEQEA
jgi:PAS domain S-box-containing protein